MLITAARQMWCLFHSFAPGEETCVYCQSSNQLNLLLRFDLMDKLLDFTPETPTHVDLPSESPCFGERRGQLPRTCLDTELEVRNLGARLGEPICKYMILTILSR
jgi:hypothetical protein